MFDVELREVSKRYGSFTALSGLNLQVDQGEFLALLGPTGCGKTTTLRLIAGLEFPDTGEVYLQGEPATQVPAHRRRTNTVFQQFALFPHLNVYDNIAYGLRVKKVARAESEDRIREAMQMLHIERHAGKLPRQLSGGEQQRVALARALVNRPAILLLDEPMSAIDRALRHEMQRQLRSLQQRLGITFVLVTHDQEEALTMSDRIAVMDHGHLVQVDTPQAVYARPSTVFVARFLGDANLVPLTVTATAARQVQGTTVDGPCVVAGAGAVAPGERALLCVRPEDARVTVAPSAQPNAFAGAVSSVAFQGSTRTLRVRLASGQNLDCLALASDDALPVGAAVWVSWPPDRCALVREEAAS